MLERCQERQPQQQQRKCTYMFNILNERWLWQRQCCFVDTNTDEDKFTQNTITFNIITLCERARAQAHAHANDQSVNREKRTVYIVMMVVLNVAHKIIYHWIASSARVRWPSIQRWQTRRIWNRWVCIQKSSHISLRIWIIIFFGNF